MRYLHLFVTDSRASSHFCRQKRGCYRGYAPAFALFTLTLAYDCRCGSDLELSNRQFTLFKIVSFCKMLFGVCSFDLVNTLLTSSHDRLAWSCDRFGLSIPPSSPLGSCRVCIVCPLFKPRKQRHLSYSLIDAIIAIRAIYIEWEALTH